MSYSPPRWRPHDAQQRPFDRVRLGDVLVLAEPWSAPPPGYRTAPVTRIQQHLAGLRDGRLHTVGLLLEDTAPVDRWTPPTAAAAARAAARLAAAGAQPVLALRIWHRLPSGYTTFVDVAPDHTATLVHKTATEADESE